MRLPALFVRNHVYWVAFGLFALTLLLYLARPLLTGRADLGGGGDTVTTRLVPVSLLREGNFDLDEFPELHPGPDLPYYLLSAHGHYYSKYPPGGPLLITPIYAALEHLGFDVLEDQDTREVAVGGIAAVISALSVLVVFLTYARRGAGRALAVAAVFGFGTGVWPLCGQDLWQHTYGVLCMSLCLFGLERGFDDDRWLGWLGLPAGVLFFVRPGNGLLVAVLFIGVFLRKRSRIIPFACLAAPFLLFTLWYNMTYLGHLFGGYDSEASGLQPWECLSSGLPGLLVSPSHGLLVYSPVLLLAAACFWEESARPRRPLCLLLAALFLVQLLTYGSFTCWYGGFCFGPRFLLEVMPACAGLLWYAWPRITSSRLSQALTLTAALWAILANGSGYCFGWSSWCLHPDVDRCKERLWDWRDCPLVDDVLGLPPRCSHPLSPTQPFLDIEGVDIELGRGWSIDEKVPALEALGSEAELIVDFHGRPAGLIVLTLECEPGLPEKQVVTAFMEGDDRKTRKTLRQSTPEQIIVPVPREFLGRKRNRLILRFTSSLRRSLLDIRTIAARLESIQIGLYDKTPFTSSPADAVSP